MLLQVSARLELDLDEKDEDNCTPLHIALLAGQAMPRHLACPSVYASAKCHHDDAPSTLERGLARVVALDHRTEQPVDGHDPQYAMGQVTLMRLGFC